MPTPGLDLHRLASHLAVGPLTATVLAGGRSNLTYLVSDGPRRFVLRRPPLGHVLATAHDMAREYRVISALGATSVPVPAPIALCEDADVLGAPFYLMSYVEGTVYRWRAQTDPLGPAVRHELAESAVDTLAALHALSPSSVGLADFGRPEGFLARQVRRWSEQLDRSRGREVPGLDELRSRLGATVPPASGVAIVHGDYRLDNLIVGPGVRVAAVLDWELATLGDPLADLGLLLVYWEGLGGLDNPIVTGIGPAAGFPTGSTLAEWYSSRTGADLAGLNWYLGLGYFKLAVILEGIHYRYTCGQTVGDGFDRVGAVVPALVDLGLGSIGR